MQILKLDTTHSQQIWNLYNRSKYMGVDVAGNWNSRPDLYNEFLFSVFKKTYLSGLNNFHAYGIIEDDGTIPCVITFYDSSDEPAWYYTQCRSAGDLDKLKQLFDGILEIQESKHRYKFYTLVNTKHAALLRRFTYSDYNDERYGYYDEFVVPAKTKCYYNNAWELLFKKVLLPVDTVVRCSYLKQEYRPKELPIGGSL